LLHLEEFAKAQRNSKMLPLNKDSKEAFLESTKAAREARKATRDREKSALRIQKWVRGWLVRIKTAKRIWTLVDTSFQPSNQAPKQAIELYRVAKLFMIFGKPSKDSERFEKVCKTLVTFYSLILYFCWFQCDSLILKVSTLDSESIKFSYVGLGLSKDHAIQWISHMKQILATCLNYLVEKQDLLPKKLSTWLSFLIAFTSIKVIYSLTDAWH